MFELFSILLITGLLLVGAEVFVPGGILGIIGGVALLGAIITAFKAFGPVYGSYIALAILILVGIVIALWVKLFPKSSIGKKMTVSVDLSESKGTESGLAQLLGATGKTLSELRPAGYAQINGHRVDVVTEGNMIAHGELIKVIEVEGNRVVVAKVKSE